MVQCLAFPGGINTSLATQVAPILNDALGLGLPNALAALFDIAYDNGTLRNVYCAAPWSGQCMGLCPNADLCAVSTHLRVEVTRTAGQDQACARLSTLRVFLMVL